MPYYVTEALELGFRYAFAISVAQVAMGGHLWVAPRAHCVTEALELRIFDGKFVDKSFFNACTSLWPVHHRDTLRSGRCLGG